MNPSIAKQNSRNNELLFFPDLPFWTGVQEDPSIKQRFSFRLGMHADGFITQTTDQKYLKMVKRAYSDESYQHITKPPGSSNWSNRLGDRYVRFIMEHLPRLDDKTVVEIGSGSLFIAQKICQTNAVKKYLAVDPANQEASTDNRIIVIRDYFSKALHGVHSQS